jgi:hypothetical protein
MGGSGFWHVNNIETFFSNKLHEWELVHAPAPEGPQQILKQFGGYDQVRDVVSVIESPPFYHQSVKDFTYKYFEKNLKSNQWSYVGDVNSALLFKLGLKTLNAEFIQGIYLFNTGDFLVLGDPVKNKIYLIEKSIPLISKFYELSERKGWLYSYHVENHFDNSKLKIDSIGIEKLKLLGIPKGEFYVRSKEEIPWWLLAGNLVAVAFVIYLVILRRRKKRLAAKLENNLEGLPEGSTDFLRGFIAYPKSHELDSSQVTELMNYSAYSYETQRQLRSKLIKGINSYFSIHYKMHEIIKRKTAKDDKRFSIYYIAEEHYDRLSELINS